MDLAWWEVRDRLLLLMLLLLFLLHQLTKHTRRNPRSLSLHTQIPLKAERSLCSCIRQCAEGAQLSAPEDALEDDSHFLHIRAAT